VVNNKQDPQNKSPTCSRHPDEANRKRAEPTAKSPSRRGFLKTASGAGVFSAAASLGLGGLLAVPAQVQASGTGQSRLDQRRQDAFQIRMQTARFHRLRDDYPNHKDNGDETRYTDRRASFFKCLPQNDLGEVDGDAYRLYRKALYSGKPADFERIPLSPEAARRLANPQAAYAFDLMGSDSWTTALPPAPAFASAENAAEIGEAYWQALARDVSFTDYPWDATTVAAIADLNSSFSDIRAPICGGQITAETLFRGGIRGDMSGPYLSQFLWYDVPYGLSLIEQRYPIPVADLDYMTDYGEWLAIQRGADSRSEVVFDNTPRYLHNGRAVSAYVQKDTLFQAFFNAALIIDRFGPDALDASNPYLHSANQEGFATFGSSHLYDMVIRAARLGLEAAWFHKWLVHRRLRPEVFAGRVQNQLEGFKDYDVHPDILASAAIDRLRARYGNALLPQAYPEGSPTHPSYPAGHSAASGACATVLKAFTNEDFIIPEPVQASADGLSLQPWIGSELTLGDEINKLASNIIMARCHAGVHYRSNGKGLAVGEAMAIGMLQDYSLTFNEHSDGFTLTTFDGKRLRIVNGKVKRA